MVAINLKKSKDSGTNEKLQVDPKSLANLVIDAIDNKNLDLNILENVQQAFASKQKQRESFIRLLDKKLNNNQLHELNKTIVENANELMPGNDPNFVCRRPHDKVFQQLLLLEAKRSGMKAKFNTEGELQPLDVKDITQEILDHYSVLQEKFYLERSSTDSLDSRVAQSINFLLYAPLVRENEKYAKLEPEKAYKVEQEIQKSDGKYVKHLVQEKIAKYASTKESREKVVNKRRENAKSLIIEEAVTKLREDNKLIIKSKGLGEVKKYLSQSLAEASDYVLTFKKNDLVNIICQELHKRQSKWSKFISYLGIKSYRISEQNLKEIEKIINNKIENFHSSTLQDEKDNLHKIAQITQELKIRNTQMKSNKPPVPPKPEYLKKRSHSR